MNLHILHKGTKLKTFTPTALDTYHDLNYSDEINGLGECCFKINHEIFSGRSKEELSQLRSVFDNYNDILITEQQSDGSEIIQWFGKIAKVPKVSEGEASYIEVHGINAKGFLQRKPYEYNYNSNHKKVKEVVSDVFNHLKQKEAEVGGDLFFELGEIEGDETTTFEIKADTDTFTIFQNLADENNMEWEIRYPNDRFSDDVKPILNFKKRIGVDTDLIFSLETLNGNHGILKYDPELDYMEYCNYVIARNSNGERKIAYDRGEIEKHGKIFKSFDYNANGQSLQNYADKMLEKMIKDKLIPVLEIDSAIYPPSYYNIGDSVRVYVQEDGSIFNIEETRFYITKIDISLENGVITPQLTLSLGKDKILKTRDLLFHFSQQIKNLRLRA